MLTLTEEASDIAQEAEFIYNRLCLPESKFQLALADAFQCMQQADSALETGKLLAVKAYIDFCDNGSEGAVVTSQLLWCAVSGFTEGILMSDCSTLYQAQLTTANTRAITSAIISTQSSDASAVTTLGTANAGAMLVGVEDQQQQPWAVSPRSTAYIVGYVAGDALCVLLCMGFIVYIMLDTRKKVQRRSYLRQQQAQLHSDDIKPIRKEMRRSNVPHARLEEQTVLNDLPTSEGGALKG